MGRILEGFYGSYYSSSWVECYIPLNLLSDKVVSKLCFGLRETLETTSPVIQWRQLWVRSYTRSFHYHLEINNKSDDPLLSLSIKFFYCLK